MGISAKNPNSQPSPMYDCRLKNPNNQGLQALFEPSSQIIHARLKDWLGRQDSNLGMAESKSTALPLGYAPTEGALTY